MDNDIINLDDFCRQFCWQTPNSVRLDYGNSNIAMGISYNQLTNEVFEQSMNNLILS